VFRNRRQQARGRRLLLALGTVIVGVIRSSPVGAEIYTWVDDRGVQNFVDGSALIPEPYRGQARLIVFPPPSLAPEPPPARRHEASTGRGTEPPPGQQATLAVTLAERLGLAFRPTPLEAATVLLERGILPPAGWILDDGVDPRSLGHLARTLLDASARGEIPQDAETVLRVLETAAAAVGVALITLESPEPSPPPVVAVPPPVVIVEQVVVPVFPLRGARLPHRVQVRSGVFQDGPHGHRTLAGSEGGRRCLPGFVFSQAGGFGHANRMKFHHALEHRSAWQRTRASIAAESCKAEGR
jgi:hypothetical protein